MGKTYKKYIKQPIACGNNTPWYDEKRKHFKRVEKNKLRSLLATKDINEVNDLTNDPKIYMHDPWREPTDGSILVYAGMKENKKWFDVEWLMNKWRKYLKSRHGLPYKTIEHNYDFEPKIL